MTESRKLRALRAFEAMGSISDFFVTSAEDTLRRAELEHHRPFSSQNPFRRFLQSGWGVATLSAIVSLTILLLLVRAGHGSIDHPSGNPPTPPPVSSIGFSEESASFTLSIADEWVYFEGVDRITVRATGKNPGETITSPGGWYLERVTATEAEPVVGFFYTEEFCIAEPAPNEYAAYTKPLSIIGGLARGDYRLHATEYNGEEYVSVAFCEFSVEYPETEYAVDESVVIQPVTDAVTYLHTDRATYPSGTTSITVILTNANVGMGLRLDSEQLVWLLHPVSLTPHGADISLEVPIYPAEDIHSILIPEPYECAQGQVVLNTDELEDGLYVLELRYVSNATFDVGCCCFTVGSNNPLNMEAYRTDSDTTPSYVTAELYLIHHFAFFLFYRNNNCYGADGYYQQQGDYLYLTTNVDTDFETQWAFQRVNNTLIAVPEQHTGFFSGDFPEGSGFYLVSGS